MTHKVVRKGICNIKEIQRALCLYIKIELFEGEPLPTVNTKCIYLEESDIINHRYNATAKLLMSKINPGNLRMKIEIWKKLILTICFIPVHIITKQHL